MDTKRINSLVIRKALILLTSVVLVLALTGCGSASKMDEGTMLTCTMFTNPDEYRVMVLVDIARGSTTVHNNIDTLVRGLKYPGRLETKDSLMIKEEFAVSLHAFADAYMGTDKNLRTIASVNLSKVSSELKAKCERLGMTYSSAGTQ